MIKAEIVAHSLSPQGDELISVLCTFPRIILAEVNTHRMLSKNTSSSRAIPFEKMVEAVQNNPFIPIAWQVEHKGMQGSEYFTNIDSIKRNEEMWLQARDNAIKSAELLNNDMRMFGKNCGTPVTKQLCNRLLEPFMWTTMLITGSKEGWDNFFRLRCPDYIFHDEHDEYHFKSKKDVINHFGEDEEVEYESGNIKLKDLSNIQWLQLNYGKAEIHMMALAEKIYDAVNESTPKQLQAGEWHIPFEDKIRDGYVTENLTKIYFDKNIPPHKAAQDIILKTSVAMAARTSYTVVGEEKEVDYSKMIELHDRLLSQNPPHSSPLEHCARAMDDKEYDTFVKGKITDRRGVYDFQNPYDYAREESIFNRKKVGGWCNNLKGFIPYRYFIDNKIEL